MRLSLQPSLRTIARCPHCSGTVADHGEGCPVLRLESLRNKQKHIRCPRCSVAAVDVGRGDFYQCRECHVQYSLAWCPLATEETVVLVIDEDAPLEVGVRTAYVLAEKGTGEFPNDDAIAQLRKGLREE